MRPSGEVPLPGVYHFVVHVSDVHGAVAASTSVSMTVLRPVLSITVPSTVNVTVGDVTLDLAKVTGGNPPYTISLAEGGDRVPAGSALDNAGGLSGAISEGGIFRLGVRVEDADGEVALSEAVTLTVQYPPISLQLTDTEKDFTVGVAVDRVLIVVATGGHPTRTFSLVEGLSLPAGLSLGGVDGVLEGAPIEAGVSVVWIRVEDADGQWAVSDALTMTVFFAPLVVVLTDTAKQFTAGAEIVRTSTVSVRGGHAPYGYSIAEDGELPAGLSLGAVDGAGGHSNRAWYPSCADQGGGFRWRLEGV